MKLFYAPGACSLAPHIVLEWIGEPYELEKVKFGDPEYTKINPLGQVPAMIDDSSGVMTQASAILQYLARKYPNAELGDDGTLQNGFEMEHWLAFFTGNVHPSFYPFFLPQRYTADNNESELNSVKEASYKLIDKVFAYLENYLNGKDHFVGNHRTIVDAYAFAMIRWGNYLPKPLSDYPNLYRFYQQLHNDEGVKRAMEQEGI